MIKIIKKEKPTFKKYNRSSIICNSKYSFYEYCNNKKFNSLSLTLKYSILLSFYSNLNKFNNLNPQKVSTKEKKVTTVHDNASELNIILLIYFLKHIIMIDVWFENEESTYKEESVDLSDMSPLEGDEEVK